MASRLAKLPKDTSMGIDFAFFGKAQYINPTTITVCGRKGATVQPQVGSNVLCCKC